MQVLTRLNIGARLGVAFALLLAMMMAIGGLSIVSLGNVNDATADLNNNWLTATRELGNSQDAINKMRRAEANVVMLKDVAAQQTEIARWKSSLDEVVAHWKLYDATVTLPEERKMADATRDAFKALAAGQEKLYAMPRGTPESDAAALKAFQEVTRPLMNDTIAALEKLGDFQQAGAEKAYAGSQAEFKSTRNLVIGLAIGAVLLGLALAWAITRSITQPISRAVEVAETVANGDLTSHIVVNSTDETGKLLGALQRMNEKLSGIVGMVRNSSDSIATGSTQIASGNADLSQRTEEQASNLQQTAASMEELTATVAQNAETAKQASQLASSASTSAAKGGEVVAQVVSTMGAITESSRRISDIIGVIDGIAFQTNILALNASVEAARAGEQGRGFAVVAGEVRGLAQRSAEAAKEIKNLIGQSVTSVEAGAKQVDEAGKAMAEIVSQVKRVNDLMGEINAASAEQSSGIGQIGDAVAQLDQVTQQNAALVEESAAAAESLRHQAAQLIEVVSQFKVDSHGAVQAAPAPKVYKAPAYKAPGNAARRMAAPKAAPAAAETPVAKAATAVAEADSWETF